MDISLAPDARAGLMTVVRFTVQKLRPTSSGEADNDAMTGRAQAWTGGVITGVAVVVLTAYLITVGLDKADKVASVVGLFVALAGLAISVAGLRRQEPTAGAQGVDGTSVGGGVTQISGTGGSVKITHRASAASGAPAPIPGAASAAPLGAGGQTVRNSSTTGPVDQVQSTEGDVEVEK